MNIHEYQAKALLHEFGVPISQGVPVLRAADSEAAAKTLPRPDLGGEEPDPCRRPRQGQVQGSLRRRQGRRAHRQVGRRGQRIRQADAGRDAGHGADRRRTASRSTGSTSRKAPTSTRSSISRSWSTAKPREVSFVVSTEGGVNIEDVAHNTPEKIVTFSVDPATGIMGHHGRTVAKALESHRRSRQAGGEAGERSSMPPSSPRTWRCWRSIRWSSPSRASCACSTPKCRSTTTRCSGIPRSRRCATRPKRTPRKSRRRNTISTTSRSTAPSAAWSTAPALPWRPWTSSSSTAWRRPTSSTSAAAPARRRWPPPSRSSPPIPT